MDEYNSPIAYDFGMEDSGLGVTYVAPNFTGPLQPGQEYATYGPAPSAPVFGSQAAQPSGIGSAIGNAFSSAGQAATAFAPLFGKQPVQPKINPNMNKPSGTPSWVLPVVIGVGVLAVGAMFMGRRKD